MLLTMSHSGKGKAMERVKGSMVVRGWRVGGWMNRQSMENFQAGENTRFGTIMMDTYIHLSKLTGLTTPRVKCYINYRLWLIMMCHCRFIDCNKHTTLIVDVDNGGGYACVEATAFGKSLYLPLHFDVNLKLL